MPRKDKEQDRSYKKAYYERKKAGRYERIKHNSLKWRKEHRLELNKYKRERYTSDNAAVNWAKWRTKFNAKSKNEARELTEKYVIKKLKQKGYTEDQIKSCPELINFYRITIKIKRQCKLSQTSIS